VPNLGLIAENGAFLREFGKTDWKEMSDPDEMNAWKDSVIGIMNYYKDRTPGSWVETRHCSLIFHYKNAEDFETASRQAGDCAGHINDACEDQHVRAIPVEGAVIVESMKWTKRTAAEIIFNNIKDGMDPARKGKYPVEFLFVVGDGREDEIVFRWANELEDKGEVPYVTTVSLGSRNTEAMKTLTQGVTGKSALTMLFALGGTNKFLGVLTVLQRLAAI
jgi:trehalose 6-phosphate synthase/phosphatase